MTLTMYDSVDPSHIPSSAQAVAGYVDGQWPTITSVRLRFPHAQLVSIAVSAVHDAMCLDIERFDAIPAQAASWVRRQLGRGAHRPILYASVSLMPTVLNYLESGGIDRTKVRLWTAHYSSEHICGPTTCGAPFTADGTQWAAYPGRSPGQYDVSLLAADFFALPAPKPPVPVEDDPDMPTIIRCSDPKHSGATLVLEQGVVVSLSQPADLAQYEKPTAAPLRTVSPGTFDQYAAKVGQ